MAELETRVSELERNVDRVMTKLDMFIEESRAARQRLDADLREAREKHDADMREIRARQDAAQAKHDAEMHEMNARFYAKFDDIDSKMNNLGQQFRNMFVVAIIGIAAMVVAVFLK